MIPSWLTSLQAGAQRAYRGRRAALPRVPATDL
jgi:hypothetical protein